MKTQRCLALSLFSTKTFCQWISTSLTSAESTEEALLFYAKWATIIRGALMVLVPMVSAGVLWLAGSFWMWLTPAVFALHMVWRRVVGVRQLSSRGQEHLDELLFEALKQGRLSSLKTLNSTGFSANAHEDHMYLCQLMLTDEGRSTLQRTCLDDRTQRVPEVSNNTPSRRL